MTEGGAVVVARFTVAHGDGFDTAEDHTLIWAYGEAGGADG